MKLIVLLTTFLMSFSCWAQQEVVVLVPGFFNSFAPEYFSQEIVQTFRQRGLKVYIAEGLSPVGTVEENGERLIKVFRQIETMENRKVTFNIVAHSAGGLYTLHLANKGLFNIKNLLTVATPYKGVEFLQRWFDNNLLFKSLTDLAHLEGLKQLTPAGVNKFLGSVRVAPNMRIVAFAGAQKRSLDIWNAKNLSLPFRVTSESISEESDGIVGVSSALGVGRLRTTENKQATQLFNSKFKINLEHWEQVLNGNTFLLLGVRNPGYVVNEQVRFYNGLADYLLTVL